MTEPHPIADDVEFAALANRYRGELQAHCRKMMGSHHDSEDLVQETFLRAWRARAGFRGESSVRAWLYRIATNACLDALDRRVPVAEHPERDRQTLEGVPAPDPEPHAAVVSSEAVELTFMLAIRYLPPKERATLILRGLVGLSAKDTASLLDGSVVSVNSALQRARRRMKNRLPEGRLEWTLGSKPSERERALLRRYLEAIERADAEAFVEALGEALSSPSRASRRERKLPRSAHDERCAVRPQLTIALTE
jgi:RNA polymerase sigma-70 factor (ECF subfamily)